LLRPEQLLDDRQFGDMVSFLAAFQTPGADWLPATWLVRVIFPALRGEPTAGLADLGMLWLTAGALLVPSTWLARSQLRRAYSRSLEGGDGLAGQARTKSIRLRFSTSPILEILRKDALLFARDPSQWSQVMLLVALVVVYIVNFKNFQLLGTAGLISELGLYYLNLGLTGFVLAAVGTRLIFPSISLEGKAFWLLRTAPMPLERILLAKWLGGLWPLLLLGGSTILVTDRMIGTPWHLSLISATTTVLLAGLVSAMGTGLGALFPSFDAENATRVASGFGGIVYMVLTMSTVVLVLALQAWPVWLLHKGLSTPRAFAAGTVAIAVGLALGSLLLAALAIVVPLRLGARSLRQLEG
jgi:ABC-2 type transport system permease protein